MRVEYSYKINQERVVRLYKELAALILEGKYDELAKGLKEQLQAQLPSHSKKSAASLLKKLGELLVQVGQSDETSGRWRIECFHAIRLIQSGREIQSMPWKRKKAEELFLYLLLQPNYRASKEAASDILFYCDDAGQISNQLYVIVHHIKQTLHQYLNIPKGISIKNGMILLSEEMIDYVDVEKYSALVRVGNQLWASYPDLSVNLYDEAQQIYGELAPQLQYVDWLDLYRKDFLLKQTSILKRLGSFYAAVGSLERAEQYYVEWIQLSPFEEEAYQELLKLYIRMNRKDTAKMWYRKMERLFRQELDIAPMSETTRIISERWI